VRQRKKEKSASEEEEWEREKACCSLTVSGGKDQRCRHWALKRKCPTQVSQLMNNE